MYDLENGLKNDLSHIINILFDIVLYLYYLAPDSFENKNPFKFVMEQQDWRIIDELIKNMK